MIDPNRLTGRETSYLPIHFSPTKILSDMSGMWGTDTLLFALLVMLFGGFGQSIDTGLFVGDTGLYVMVVGLLGFWQAAREAVSE